MSGRVNDVPQVGYCPSSVQCVCQKCLMRIRPGQMRFNKGQVSTDWFHFWCMLEKKSRTSMAIQGRQPWNIDYHNDASKCPGYELLLPEDQVTFSAAFVEMDFAIVRGKKEERVRPDKIEIADRNSELVQVETHNGRESEVPASLGHDDAVKTALTVVPPVAEPLVPALELPSPMQIVSAGLASMPGPSAKKRKINDISIANRSPKHTDISLPPTSNDSVLKSNSETVGQRRAETIEQEPEFVEIRPTTKPEPAIPQPMQVDFPSNLDFMVGYHENPIKSCICSEGGSEERISHDKHNSGKTSFLVFGRRTSGGVDYQHVACMTDEYLAELRTRWKALGKKVKLQDFITGFDALAREDQVQLFLSIKGKNNKFRESIPEQPEQSPSTHIQAHISTPVAPDKQLDSPQIDAPIQNLAVVNREDSGIREDALPNAENRRAAGSSTTPSESPQIGEEYFVLDPATDQMWALRVVKKPIDDEQKDFSLYWLENGIVRVNEERPMWREKECFKQKLGRWGALKLPMKITEQAIPYLQDAIVEIFQAGEHNSVMVMYGKHDKYRYDWIYVHLTSGVWWRQQPAQNFTRDRPIGYGLLAPTKWLWLMDDEPVPSVSRDTHLPALMIFDLHLQEWEPVSNNTDEDYRPSSSAVMAASRHELGQEQSTPVGNVLAVHGTRVFMLPQKFKPGIPCKSIDTICSIDLASRLQSSTSAPEEIEVTEIPCHATVATPSNLAYATLSMLDEKTLLLQGKTKMDDPDLQVWVCHLSSATIDQNTRATWRQFDILGQLSRPLRITWWSGALVAGNTLSVFWKKLMAGSYLDGNYTYSLHEDSTTNGQQDSQ